MSAVKKQLTRTTLIATLMLVMTFVLVLATSCTAAVRSSQTPPPDDVDVGFVTQGDEVTGIARRGDVKDPCSHELGGAAFVAGPTPVYPRARPLLPDNGTRHTQITIETLAQGPGPIPVTPRPAPTVARNITPRVDFRALESDDSWQTIVRWYQSAMPKGAEVTTAACQAFMSKNNFEIAQFSEGLRTKNYRDVLITGVPANERLNGLLHGQKAPRTLIIITESLNGSEPGVAR